MKRLQDHLKTISKALSALSKKIDQATTRIEKLQAAKPKSAKKAAPKKKAPAKKTVAKRKAAAKKPAAKKKAPVTRSTALDSVLNVVNKSKKGITIAALKEKTGYNPKQLSNALYKLSKKDMITKKSRGVYVKK
ncbi:MAG: hypothetical protein ABII68_05710 [Pseudomonadota bacterium]